MIKLTVLIPTYNRKEYLKNLLTTLYGQGHYGEYSIIISDNHSDYNVMDMIKDSFNDEFVEMISYHNWNYNIGQMTNCSVPFSFVETEWCLLLSDDDAIMPNTLDVTLRDANDSDNQNVAAIKYSLAKYGTGKFIHEDRIVHTVAELSTYYLQYTPGKDDRMYLSMLYNLRLLRPYLIKLTQYSYTGLSFLLPVITAMAEGKGYLKLSSEGLYEYNINLTESWYSNNKRYLETILGIRTIVDSFHSMDYKSLKLFRKMILSELFRCKIIIRVILHLNGFSERLYNYKLLRDYMIGNIWQQFLYRSFFWIILLLNISPSTITMIANRIRGVNN